MKFYEKKTKLTFVWFHHHVVDVRALGEIWMPRVHVGKLDAHKVLDHHVSRLQTHAQ